MSLLSVTRNYCKKLLLIGLRDNVHTLGKNTKQQAIIGAKIGSFLTYGVFFRHVTIYQKQHQFPPMYYTAEAGEMTDEKYFDKSITRLFWSIFLR